MKTADSPLYMSSNIDNTMHYSYRCMKILTWFVYITIIFLCFGSTSAKRVTIYILANDRVLSTVYTI